MAEGDRRDEQVGRPERSALGDQFRFQPAREHLSEVPFRRHDFGNYVGRGGDELSPTRAGRRTTRLQFSK